MAETRVTSEQVLRDRATRAFRLAQRLQASDPGVRDIFSPFPGALPTVQIDFARPVYLNIYRDRIWITKDGDIVPIQEMQTNHLKNCIKLCKAKPDWWRTELFLKTLEEELVRRESNTEEKPKKRRIRTTNEDSAVGIETQATKLTDK